MAGFPITDVHKPIGDAAASGGGSMDARQSQKRR